MNPTTSWACFLSNHARCTGKMLVLTLKDGRLVRSQEACVCPHHALRAKHPKKVT